MVSYCDDPSESSLNKICKNYFLFIVLNVCPSLNYFTVHTFSVGYNRKPNVHNIFNFVFPGSAVRAQRFRRPILHGIHGKQCSQYVFHHLNLLLFQLIELRNPHFEVDHYASRPLSECQHRKYILLQTLTNLARVF